MLLYAAPQSTEASAPDLKFWLPVRGTRPQTAGYGVKRPTMTDILVHLQVPPCAEATAWGAEPSAKTARQSVPSQELEVHHYLVQVVERPWTALWAPRSPPRARSRHAFPALHAAGVPNYFETRPHQSEVVLPETPGLSTLA